MKSTRFYEMHNYARRHIEDILLNTPPPKKEKKSRAYTHIKSIFSSGKSLNIPVVISNGNTCKT